MAKGIASIIFLAAAIAIFFGLTRPFYNEVKSLRVQKYSFEEALSKSKEVQELRDNLLSQYNKISQENLERLNKMLPNQAGSMKFVVEMEGIVQRNGMILKNIDIKEGEQKSGQTNLGAGVEIETWETVPFSVRLSGSYGAFHSFLRDVEKNLRITDIAAVSFSAGEIDFYEFSVEGTFYWKR